MKKNGFTLVELLSVLVIVSIISTIAVISIKKLRGDFNNNYYSTISKNISLAAKDYSTDYRSKITKDGIKIDITTFVQKGYIKDVKDLNKKDCTGYAIIKRKGIGYDTKVCLICDNYKSDECN